MCVYVLGGDKVKKENKHTRDLKFQLVNKRWHH